MALVGGPNFEYAPAPPAIIDKVARIKVIADRHSVSMKAAGLQFSLAHPAVAAVIPGASRPRRIAEDSAALVETDAVVEDADLIEMASCAANGEKFNLLCAGDMTGYPSQSEADLALLSILAFYTNSNEQVRRLFRMSALGKREKAVKNDTYLNFALAKIRAKQPPPVNLDELAQNAMAMRAPPPPPPLPPPPIPPVNRPSSCINSCLSPTCTMTRARAA